MWIVLTAVLIALSVAFVIFVWNPFDNGVGKEQLPEVARALMITGAKGAVTRVDHVGSDIWFSFERLDESEPSTSVALRIPRKDWSRKIEPGLREYYESRGFEYCENQENQSILARVIIPIDNIWDRASGAQAAHAARLLLQKLEISLDARFKPTELGPISMRALEPSNLNKVNQ